MQEAYSVAQITRRIRTLIANDEALQNVRVRGEVSEWKQYGGSGHCYFKLKEGKIVLNCVMWSSSAARHVALPRDGDDVVVQGYVDVYEDRGAYQFYAERIVPLGVGDLYREFELLKQQLADEGLFDLDRKRPLPAFPARIGIVTSPEAAAFQDVLNVLRRRYPLAAVILSPTAVQGADAPPQIVRAIQRLNARDDIDVILICRGGGALEDLWAFNDEQVARAVANSRIPTICGVGHETDFTLADFAADVRAPTPSAAAEQMTPDLLELRVRLDRAQREVIDLVVDSLENRRETIHAFEMSLRRAAPLNAVRGFRQRLDEYDSRMTLALGRRFGQLRERIAGQERALVAASPQAILAKGYALITDADGNRIVSVQTADKTKGRRVTVQFADGQVGATFEEV